MFKPSLAIALLSGTLVSLSLRPVSKRIACLPPTKKMPQVVQRYQALTDDLVTKYRQHTDELKVTQMVAHQGQRLWQQAVRDVQSGHSDDRSLYWSRLQMRAELGKQSPKFNIASWQREILTKAVEKSSRGFSDIDFKDDASIKILLTGFDPFFLDRNIEQSNPSGLVALALDGYRFSVNGRQAQIETVMIRYVSPTLMRHHRVAVNPDLSRQECRHGGHCQYGAQRLRSGTLSGPQPQRRSPGQPQCFYRRQ